MNTYQYKNALPKYLKIRSWLQENISNGNLKPGDKLPTEEELSKLFHVNRMTVRKAIDEFVVEQMISRKQGIGTYLLSNKSKNLTYNIGNLNGLLSDLKSHGVNSKVINISKVKIIADKRVRVLLNLKQNSSVLFILRVVYADQEPIVIANSYLPYITYKALSKMDFTEGLYDLLVNRYKVQMHHSQDIFSVRMPNDDEINLYNKRYSGPCIKLESIVFDPEDKPIGVFDALFRGDKYRFKFASGEFLFRK